MERGREGIWAGKLFYHLQIAKPQILRLILQLQICKCFRFSRLPIANPKILYH
jgi:hypothetical protein